MKKLIFALALALTPALAWGQCTGVFAAKTICGNLGATAAPPSAWSSSGTIVGPVTSTLNGLPYWLDTNGQQLGDANGNTVAGAYTWSGNQTWSANNTFQTGTTNFTGTFQVGGQTFTWPLAGTTVGGLTTTQTWSGANTYSGNIHYTLSGLNVYANSSTGNDANDCLAASSSGGHAPCATATHALAVGLQYDAGNSPLILNLAAGTYTGSLFIAGAPRGAVGVNQSQFGVYIIGAGSALTILDDTSGDCGTLITSGSGTQVVLEDIKIQKTSGCANGGSAIFAQDLSFVALGTDVSFGVAGSSGGQHIHSEGNSVVEITADYTIAGNASYHWGVSHGGSILDDGHTATCNGVTAFGTGFAQAQEGGKIITLSGTAFSGCGAVTGSKFSVSSNAIIDTINGTPTLFPGSVAGIRYSGGLYLPLAVPTIGTCANGAITAGGNDNSFQIVWSGAGSSCSINFYVPRSAAANCVVVGNSASIAPVMGPSVVTGTSFTGTFANSNFVNVMCPN